MFRNLIAGLLGVAGIALAAFPASAENVTLRFSSWLPANHWYVEGSILPYLKEIEEVTQGRVKVEMLPKMVGTPQTQFDVTRDGLADMSWFVAGYTPGRFRMAEMGELAFNGSGTKTGAAFNRVYNEHFAQYKEFDGVELLSIYTSSPFNVATKNREIHKIEDFKGLKLRSAAIGATEALNILGAVPILKSSTEAFEMLSTGAIDGSLMFPETVVSSNAIDLMNTYTIIPDGFFSSVQGVIINAESWARITPEDQAAIKAVSGEKFATRIGEAYERQNSLGYEGMKKANYKINELSAEETQKLKDLLKPIEEQWIVKAKEKGAADPAAALNAFRTISLGQ